MLYRMTSQHHKQDVDSHRIHGSFGNASNLSSLCVAVHVCVYLYLHNLITCGGLSTNILPLTTKTVSAINLLIRLFCHFKNVMLCK